ncbi:hypothetical protein OCA5_c23960 [Afipia carboxidovorans OM5]|uniref:Uncharacterized protein n=1 Tax=Afipia carboxidovorans (strain ATCC 49405 / DSM 1227 / KCTC 32145 / OM5) TaxID=504832 RepID=F8C027_AFIC5|nr:hypothetical protein [Afipia carboxidovorans]AEI03515.1 hypothetical protein OCA4_c23950 [Afipia carboxidovorans OM4]AEI07092.1 hypothetical protein OCA5_c23960 [Afipia carboxidovorans OM5]
MTAILSWLASLLSGPIVNGVIDGYKAKLAAGNDKDRIAADLAQRELEVQRAEIEAQAQIRIATVGRFYEPEKIMGYAVAIYIAKLLVWDKVLGLGSTDPLGGWIETTANLVVAFYFGKRGAESVAKIVTGALRK